MEPTEGLTPKSPEAPFGAYTVFLKLNYVGI
jgi:hypothetical protein